MIEVYKILAITYNTDVNIHLKQQKDNIN